MTDISDERLAKIMAMPDEDIDTSDIPEWTEEDFQNARIVKPKIAASPRLDRDTSAGN